MLLPFDGCTVIERKCKGNVLILSYFQKGTTGNCGPAIMKNNEVQMARDDDDSDCAGRSSQEWRMRRICIPQWHRWQGISCAVKFSGH